MLSGKLTLSKAAPFRCSLLHTATVGDLLGYVCAVTYVGPQHRPDQETVSRHDKMRRGDIVVTRVARHYALGRIGLDLKTQTAVETQDARSDALNRACDLAGTDHRVFLYELAASSNFVQINCSDSFGPKSVHGERRIKSRTR
jgi:hypothetical protein